MSRLLGATISILCLWFVGACASQDDAITIYALVTTTNEPNFLKDMSTLARKHGLTPNVGRSTDDRGHTVNVVVANGRGVKLWGQNMPLSGHEDRTLCGSHGEPYPDPGQFVIYIKPATVFSGNAAAIELAAQLRQEFSQLGYDVRETPARCSALAKFALDRA